MGNKVWVWKEINKNQPTNPLAIVTVCCQSSFELLEFILLNSWSYSFSLIGFECKAGIRMTVCPGPPQENCEWGQLFDIKSCPLQPHLFPGTVSLRSLLTARAYLRKVFFCSLEGIKDMPRLIMFYNSNYNLILRSFLQHLQARSRVWQGFASMVSHSDCPVASEHALSFTGPS